MLVAGYVDPHAAFASLLLAEGSNDGFSSRVNRLEFQEGAGFVAQDFEILDWAETRDERLFEESLCDALGYTLDEAMSCGNGLSGYQRRVVVPLLIGTAMVRVSRCDCRSRGWCCGRLRSTTR